MNDRQAPIPGNPAAAGEASGAGGPDRRRAGEPDRRRLSDQEKVVRAFFRDGRLVSIPAKTSKRDLLLPVILDRCFPDDRDYEEKEVNMRLALLHPDVAALRRHLVDGRLMTREAGIYRRARSLTTDPAG
ncbi:MAG TPA: DUF2087 domain-containing protein [Candidatus Limnocylindrales bacterium]|nr:DUF2087 domain-containing protein [Candidatus Limnocylindrales bacterium]